MFHFLRTLNKIVFRSWLIIGLYKNKSRKKFKKNKKRKNHVLSFQDKLRKFGWSYTLLLNIIGLLRKTPILCFIEFLRLFNPVKSTCIDYLRLVRPLPEPLCWLVRIISTKTLYVLRFGLTKFRSVSYQDFKIHDFQKCIKNYLTLIMGL